MSFNVSLRLLPLLLLGLVSCSSGGSNDTPSQGVQLAVDYHLVGLSARTTLAWPVPEKSVDVFSNGSVSLTDQGEYEIKLNTGSDKGQYNLTETGLISLLIPQPNSPSLVLQGGVDREGEAFWFTDRNISGDQDLALWAAVKQKADAKLTGRWNVAMINIVHAPSTAASDPDQVAWVATGSIEVDSAAKVTGSFADSTGATLTPTGTVADFKVGKLDLTLKWDRGSLTENFAFQGAVGENFFIASCKSTANEPNDTLLLGVKAANNKLLPAKLTGNYHLATLTCFIDPKQAAVDVAAGRFELNGKDAFTSTMYGPYTPNGFQFRGSFAVADKGLISFTETYPVAIPLWGAATEDGKVILMADITKEKSDPDVSLFIAIQEWVKPGG